MSDIKLVLDKWNSADSIEEFQTEEIVAMLDRMVEWIEHRPDYEKELNEISVIAIESKIIIEQFQKLLGVYTSTEALSKIAVLMREENEIIEIAKDHYWDSLEPYKELIIKHLQGIMSAPLEEK